MSNSNQSDLDGQAADSVLISAEEIDHPKLTESVRRNDCGAVVLFLGTVREFTAGKQTVALSYQAFEEMATTELHKLIRVAREQWGLGCISIIHRTGPLELGDIAVGIAVSSPHRAEAFAAAEFLMDEIKQKVPIWKKEHWADGSSEWVHPGLDQT